MYYVYILRSFKSGKFYIGSTSDIKRRLQEHNSDQSRYTRLRGPWKLIYLEKKPCLAEARIRERFLKTGDGRKTVKNLLR